MGAGVSKPVHSTNDFELAIVSSKRLEHLLEQEFGAQGKGLHEKITSASRNSNELSPQLVKNMRFLATIRNKLVHEHGFDWIPDRDKFIQKFDASWEELAYTIEQRRKRKRKKNPGEPCIVM